MTFLSRSIVNATGAATTFAVSFPFIKRADVKVTLGGMAVPFSWVTDGQLSITPAPSGVLRIERRTAIAARLTDYSDTARLTEKVLDRDSLQAFYLLQEVWDDYQELQADVGDLRDDLVSFQDYAAEALSNVYTKAEIDELVTDALADALSAYYTKTEVETLLENIEATAGPQGPAGPPGPPGSNGTNGTNGTNGAPGAAGTQGPAGLSAYQLAVANGYSGDLASWLASLQGENGAPGPQGPAGTNGANGTNGVDGAPGATGPQGPAGAGGFSNMQVFTANGTFTVPAGVYRIMVEAWGGGEGGRGNANNVGGASGGYCLKLATVAPTNVIDITIGAAGTAGDSAGGSGGGGGTTQVYRSGVLNLFAYGAGSSAGGSAAGGDLNFVGQSASFANGTTFMTNGNSAPRGGSGGSGQRYANGNNGALPGGGGGAGGAGYAGGAGASGMVIIWY